MNTSEGNVSTKNLHSTKLSLITQNGNIRCDGSTLSQQMDLRTFGDKVDFTVLFPLSFEKSILIHYNIGLFFAFVLFAKFFVDNPFAESIG